MYERILVATDGSEFADCAVDRAAKLASRLGAELLIETVIPHTAEFNFVGITTAQEGTLREFYQEVLAKAQTRAAKYHDKIRTRLDEGPPAEYILRAAQEEKADLVVVASCGRSHRERTGSIMGGVAARVNHLADQDVLVVH
ncbi:MAG: universal stress protein [Thermaerobacter sp.]|jgi:nucleotide-binding universal stress UspA family protein|nr:universal stress protein [Thermaerobacter sp.]